MTWQRKKPGHQQPRYWLWSIEIATKWLWIPDHISPMKESLQILLRDRYIHYMYGHQHIITKVLCKHLNFHFIHIYATHPANHSTDWGHPVLSVSTYHLCNLYIDGIRVLRKFPSLSLEVYIWKRINDVCSQFLKHGRKSFGVSVSSSICIYWNVHATCPYFMDCDELFMFIFFSDSILNIINVLI